MEFLDGVRWPLCMVWPIASKRKPGGVVLRRAFVDEVVSYDLSRSDSLLQQRHPLRLGIPAAAGDAVQVYAAGHTGASGVSTVPRNLITSCSLHLIHQCLEYRQQLLAYKHETPYTYRVRRPDDVPDEEVSFCYQDHGNWQT